LVFKMYYKLGPRNTVVDLSRDLLKMMNVRNKSNLRSILQQR
jgi:hypothetical protein